MEQKFHNIDTKNSENIWRLEMYGQQKKGNLKTDKFLRVWISIRVSLSKQILDIARKTIYSNTLFFFFTILLLFSLINLERIFNLLKLRRKIEEII